MKSGLSLRTRLLAGLGVVAFTLTAVAAVITITTRNDLISQVDDQLTATVDPGRVGTFPAPRPDAEPPAGASADRPERISSMYEGILLATGELVTFFEPNVPGETLGPPGLDLTTVIEADGDAFTVDSIDGAAQYRVVATVAGDDWFVRALPLTDVNSATNRLVALQAVGIGAALLMLAAVAWWMIRLGIAPIESLTAAAATLDDRDPDAQLPEPTVAGSETRTLALALNTMLERINVAASEQQATEARLRRFVADASHELRTPVTTIAGYADLYRRGGLRETADLDDAMRRTNDEAQRMARLVEDMLTLARHDQQRPLDDAPVDLSHVLSDLAADAAATHLAHRIVVQVAPEIVVRGDDDHLRRAFGNVVTNAAVHTPAGTTITITATVDANGANVEIADDGDGIEAEHLERLTERFYRAEPSRARVSGGSGLGLAIADTAIEAHGGTLRVDSQPGRGTTVRATLPLAAEATSTDATPVAVTPR